MMKLLIIQLYGDFDMPYFSEGYVFEGDIIKTTIIKDVIGCNPSLFNPGDNTNYLSLVDDTDERIVSLVSGYIAGVCKHYGGIKIKDDNVHKINIGD